VFLLSGSNLGKKSKTFPLRKEIMREFVSIQTKGCKVMKRFQLNTEIALLMLANMSGEF
jgi:hypothetical protein